MKYFALLTKLGENLIAQATALGTKIELTHMAVGDGGGKLPTPDTNQLKLIAEKRRAAINTLFIDEKNKNQIIAEQIIPESDGGWWIREIGLFDKTGNLIAIANCPETYKPQLVEGSGRTQSIRMVLIVSHTESVILKVDPSVVLATREYVNTEITVLDEKISEALNNKLDKAVVIQNTGSSTTYIMSQKAVTEGLEKKINTTALVQSTGSNLYSLMSQRATTEALNLKVNYATIKQEVGDSEYSILSQKAVTDELRKLQPKDDYATKSEVKNGLDGKLNTSAVKQTTGTSTAYIMSQKAVTDELDKKINTTALVQSTGYNQYSIMSQKVATEALDNKVNYSAIVQTTGQNQYSIMSQKTVTDSLFGVAQVWKDVLSERSSGTTYTNSSSKPISVSITQIGGKEITLEITVNGVVISRPSSAGVSRCFITFTVPAGNTYKVSVTGSEIINWAELR